LTWGLPIGLVAILSLVLLLQPGEVDPGNWFQARLQGSLQIMENVAITPIAPGNGSNGAAEGFVALRPMDTGEQTGERETLESSPNPEAQAVQQPGIAFNADLQQRQPSATLSEGVVEAGAPSAEEEASPVESATPAPEPTQPDLIPPTQEPASSTPEEETPDPSPTPPPAEETPASRVLLGQVVEEEDQADPPQTDEATPAPTEEAGEEAAESDSEDAPAQAEEAALASANLRATVVAAQAEATRISTPAATPTPSPAGPATATSTPQPTASPVQSGSYTVRSGDTLVGIAARFDLTTQELITANNLTTQSAANLRVGQVLVLPGIPGPEDEATQTYTIRAGDTLVGIALRFNVSTEALLRANGFSEADARRIRPDQVIIIPQAGEGSPAQPQASVPRPTATPLAYTVRAGDTVITIAQRYQISYNDLLAFNRLNATSARNLRVGDLLLIPLAGQTLPTATATSTPLPTRPVSTATPTPTSAPVYRLPAPTLRQPETGITVNCSAANEYLRWNQVSGMEAGDGYVLFLGYVNGPEDSQGNAPINWVLRQETGQRNDWRMDGQLCNLAPQAWDRRWQWYVQIFANDSPISPPSLLWSFNWR
jgi:LysM repeat protein